jgi:two-component system phosphate regulon response regulator PhoB
MEGLAEDHADATIPSPEDTRGQRVLIIERDASSVQTLRSKLSQAGFLVRMLSDGEDARAAIDCDDPHLVIVEWDLPSVMTRNLVQHVGGTVPSRRPRLIALSNVAGEEEIVTSFELGVDDYVIKPYSAAEVVARVRALLRATHTRKPDLDFLEFHQIQLDASGGHVIVGNDVLCLRGTEFRLLEFLMRYPERAFTRQTLLHRVWGRDSMAGEHAVDVNIQRIRRTLAPHGCDTYVQTVRGIGYRLSANSIPGAAPAATAAPRSRRAK